MFLTWKAEQNFEHIFKHKHIIIQNTSLQNSRTQEYGDAKSLTVMKKTFPIKEWNL